MLRELIEALLINEEEYNYSSNAAGDFVQINKGATRKNNSVYSGKTSFNQLIKMLNGRQFIVPA